MKMSKGTKGFTLVELIVVIAILMILSVLGVNAFGNVMGQAQDAARRSDANMLVRSLNMFNSFATGDSRVESTTALAGIAGVAVDGQMIVRLELIRGSGTAEAGVQPNAGIDMPFIVTVSEDRFADIISGEGIHITYNAANEMWIVAGE